MEVKIVTLPAGELLNLFREALQSEEFRTVIREELAKASSGPAASGNDLLTVKEAATFLNLSTATIYAHVSSNTVPFHKKPGTKRVYFLKSELITWVQDGSTGSNVVSLEDDFLNANKRKRSKRA